MYVHAQAGRYFDRRLSEFFVTQLCPLLHFANFLSNKKLFCQQVFSLS
jgi:hypothetical protein